MGPAFPCPLLKNDVKQLPRTLPLAAIRSVPCFPRSWLYSLLSDQRLSSCVSQHVSMTVFLWFASLLHLRFLLPVSSVRVFCFVLFFPFFFSDSLHFSRNCCLFSPFACWFSSLQSLHSGLSINVLVSSFR